MSNVVYPSAGGSHMTVIITQWRREAKFPFHMSTIMALFPWSGGVEVCQQQVDLSRPCRLGPFKTQTIRGCPSLKRFVKEA